MSSGDVLPLNSRNAFLLVSQCGFLVATHWKQLACHLGVSLDDRNKLEMLAILARDFSHALEECLDIWLKGNVNASWENLINGVELLELITADKMRQALHTKQLSLSHHHSAHQVEMAASIIQRHLNELCEVIKDPVPIACHLFERKVIDDTYYQAAICPHSLQFKEMSLRTIQLLNAVYQTAVDRCRVDVISIFISILEEMELVKSLAIMMRAEFDQVMLISTTCVSTGDTTMSPLCQNYVSISEATPPREDTCTNVEFVNIDVVLTLNAEQKFDKMRMRFGSIVQKLCKNLTSKPVTLRDLKDHLIFSFSDLEEYIEQCSSIAEVMKVLRKSNYCSFANCLIVECLVQEFELEDIAKDLKCYCSERSEYYETIMAEDFIQEAYECIGRNRKVVFRLDWKKEEKSLAEFEQMLRAVFQGAAKYIRLKQVNIGSLLMVCECSEFVVGSLTIIIQERERLLSSYGVMKITIDGVVVMKITPKLHHGDAFDDHSASSQENTTITDGSRRIRSRTSSDMRDIDLLPESLLSPVRDKPSTPPPIPPHISMHKQVKEPMMRDPPRVPLLYSYSIPAPSQPHHVTARSMSDASTRPPYPLPLRSVSLSITDIHPYTDLSDSSDLSPPTIEDSQLLQTDSGIAGSVFSGEDDDHLKKPTVIIDSSVFNSDDNDPFKKYTWYWDTLPREEINKELFNTPDGTFIVRKANPPLLHKYFIVFRHDGNTKSVTVMFNNNKYNVKGSQITFDTLPSVIDYHLVTPLSLFNGGSVLLTLGYHEGIDGVEEQQEHVFDIKQLITKLKEVSDLFDSKNYVYQAKLALKAEARKTLSDLNSAITGYKNTSELFQESRQTLEQNYKVEKINTLSLNRISRCYKVIQSKIDEVESELSAKLGSKFTVGSHHQSLEMMCNLLRIELTSLSEERDVLTRQLIDCGFTLDEIYGVIKRKAFNEAENTYVTFYKPQMDDEETFSSNVYEYVVLGSTRHRGVVKHERHEYEYPKWSLRSKKQMQREPYYETVNPNTKSFDVAKSSVTKSVGFSSSSPDLSRLLGRSPSVPEKDKGEKIILWKPAFWYFDVDGKVADKMLTDKPNGTFLCRPAGREPLKEGGIHVYTVHVVNKKKVAYLKVIRLNGMFGFSIPCIFNSLYDLIVHHSNTSLQVYDPRLCVALEYPVHRHKVR